MLKYVNSGVILSTKDDRDFVIAQFNPMVDKLDNYEVMLKLPDTQVIKNQIWTSACVAFTLMLGRAIAEYNQSNHWINFDEYMLYGTRYPNHWTGQGMMLREALEVLYKEGAYYKYDFGKVQDVPEIMDSVSEFKKNNPNLVENAKKYKISGYSMVGSEYSIKRALSLGMPVMGAWILFDTFFNTGDDGYVKYSDSTKGESHGHHAMLIVGCTKTHWIVLNSWGIEYGFKGLYYIPFNYRPVEAWAISDNIMPAKKKAKSITLKIGSDTVIVDGVNTKIDIGPRLINERTMVPIRVITESLGASVQWIEDTKTVIIRGPEAVIEMSIGSKDYKVNGTTKQMDVVPVQVEDSRTLVPIRFISEEMNCKVDWIEETQEVIIKCL